MAERPETFADRVREQLREIGIPRLLIGVFLLLLLTIAVVTRMDLANLLTVSEALALAGRVGDTATVRVLEENLRIIDAAIDEAKRALVADPANSYLNGHLVNSMQRKLDLLRRVAAIASVET